jgi:hypothetical protein
VVKVSRRRRDLDETLTAQPPYALVGVVGVPEVQISPMRAIWRRVAIALLGVVRDGRLLRVDSPEADAIEAGDRLLYVRNTGK